MIYGICPFVRFSRIQNSFPLHTSVGYDHRLFYCLSGSGEIDIGDTAYAIAPGSVIYWRSGLAYKFRPSDTEPFILEGFNFDFFNPDREHPLPIAPTDADGFCPQDVREYPDFADGTFTDPIVIDNAFRFKDMFDSVENEFSHKKLYYDDCCQAGISLILTEIKRSVDTETSEYKSDRIDEILNYIKDHLDRDLSNGSVGKQFGYHANYINRLVVKSTGVSLHQYVIGCRINKAMQLLHDTDEGIAQIAVMTGFSDPSAFSKAFYKHLGMSPGCFRKGLKKT